MSLKINSQANGINGYKNNIEAGVNKNSAQYKAVVRDSMSSIMESEMMMSDEERLIYETFGGRERIIQNKMKLYESNGRMINGFGIAGMDATGIPISQRHKIISISEEARQNMFNETLRHFKAEKGVANGDTTRRSDIFKKYQLSVPNEDRLKGTWTLEQYEKAYRKAFYDACKKVDSEWELGKDIPSGALEGLTREAIDNSLEKAQGEYGETLIFKSLDSHTQSN